MCVCCVALFSPTPHVLIVRACPRAVCAAQRRRKPAAKQQPLRRDEEEEDEEEGYDDSDGRCVCVCVVCGRWGGVE